MDPLHHPGTCSGCCCSNSRYTLVVRQQPRQARMCGFGEKDRRPIDPPPIVQLSVSYSNLPLRDPFFVVHCTLWSEDGLQDRNLIISDPEPPSTSPSTTSRMTRVLMGSLVSSPSILEDESGTEGCFFCFPDLSIRTEGKYRLKFSLMRLGPQDFVPNSKTAVIADVFTDPFIVYSAKKFPGMTGDKLFFPFLTLESTELTKTFARQGLRIPVRNDVRQKKDKNKLPDD